MHAEGRWRLYERLLLRRAGFGVHLMTDLGDPPTGLACAALAESHRELEEARAVLLGTVIPEAVAASADSGDRAALRRWSALRRDVGRRRAPRADVPGSGSLPEAVCRYAEAVDAVAEGEGAVRDALAAETRERPGRIAEFLRTPGVQDAIAQLAPSFHAQVERWLARPEGRGTNTKERAFARRSFLYAQRLGAKNETTSFFGPLVHGRIDPGTEGVALSDAADSRAEGVGEVRAHVSFWAVRALARAMASDPRVAPRVPVTWVPAAKRTQDTVALPGGRTLALSAAGVRLAAAVDGTRDRAELARIAGLDEDETAHLLDRLARVGALRTWPEPPSAAPAPISVLRADAERIADGTDWPARLARFSGRADAYAAAEGARERLGALRDLEEDFVDLTGAEPRRASGRMYADRSVVSVDALGEESPFLLGEGTARTWEESLSPVLDLAGHHGLLYRDAHRELAAALLAESGPVPYQDLITRMGEAVGNGALTEHLKPFEEFGERYRELVEEHLAGDGTARIGADRLRGLVGPVDQPLFSSPDVMLEQDVRGNRVLVLGELHPYVFAWGSQGLFAEDDPGLHRAFGQDLSPWGGPERIATVIRRRSHKGLVAEWFPGRFIEVTAEATRDRNRSLPISDLVADIGDGAPRLRSPEGEVVLYSGEDDHPHLLAFSAPAPMLPSASLGEWCPRVMVGDVLVQRMRFSVGAEELGAVAGTGADDAFCAVQRLRARRGVPRFVFAHVRGEPKPVGIDLSAPLAVETLIRMVVAGEASSVTLTEMRPSPEGLWLRHRGRPTTSEFRLALRREGR